MNVSILYIGITVTSFSQFSDTDHHEYLSISLAYTRIGPSLHFSISLFFYFPLLLFFCNEFILTFPNDQFTKFVKHQELYTVVSIQALLQSCSKLPSLKPQQAWLHTQGYNNTTPQPNFLFQRYIFHDFCWIGRKGPWFVPSEWYSLVAQSQSCLLSTQWV